VISEAALRLWQLDISEIRNPEAWIHGLLNNIIVDSFRQGLKFKPLDSEPFSQEYMQLPMDGLSELEKTIIQLRLDGNTMTDIGLKLGISCSTVSKYLKNLEREFYEK
jgi:DNA-binding NarL/FixJ family response regulator